MPSSMLIRSTTSPMRQSALTPLPQPAKHWADASVRAFQYSAADRSPGRGNRLPPGIPPGLRHSCPTLLRALPLPIDAGAYLTQDHFLPACRLSRLRLGGANHQTLRPGCSARVIGECRNYLAPLAPGSPTWNCPLVTPEKFIATWKDNSL